MWGGGGGVGVWVRGQCWVTFLFPYTLLLRQGLSVNLKLTDSVDWPDSKSLGAS